MLVVMFMAMSAVIVMVVPVIRMTMMFMFTGRIVYVARLTMRRLVAMIMMIVLVIMVMSMLVFAMIMLGVIMLGVIVFAMIMLAMRVRLCGLRFLHGLIGAAIRLERRFYMDDFCPQRLHHVFQHVITSDADTFWENFGGRVPVAQMIGKPDHQSGITGADFSQLFRRCDDFDQTAVFQNKGIAAANMHCIGQIQQKLRTAHPRHGYTPAVPLLIVKHNGISSLRLPGALAGNEIRADHDGLLHNTGYGRRRRSATGRAKPAISLLPTENYKTPLWRKCWMPPGPEISSRTRIAPGISAERLRTPPAYISGKSNWGGTEPP